MGERATDAALKAIAEPRRRAILRLVADDELAAGEIAAAFDVTRTAVSQHLTVLKNAGLVTERRLGTRRLYRARPEGLDGLREFLNEMWSASPDAARQMVEADRGRSDAGPSAQAAGGDQLAAGPVGDSPAEDEDICGLGIYQKESLDEVRRLIEQDPGVQQGLYCFDVMTWRTAPGTVTAPATAWARG